MQRSRTTFKGRLLLSCYVGHPVFKCVRLMLKMESKPEECARRSKRKRKSDPPTGSKSLNTFTSNMFKEQKIIYHTNSLYVIHWIMFLMFSIEFLESDVLLDFFEHPRDTSEEETPNQGSNACKYNTNLINKSIKHLQLTEY